MDFKKEHFSKSFISKFEEEDLTIFLDFCRCYYTKFGEYVSKEEIIQQMEKLDYAMHFSSQNSRAMATHYVQTSDSYKKIDSLYLRINDVAWNKATIEEKKAIIYHELIHHFSTREIEGRKIQRGLGHIDRENKEPSYLDEVMTEYYANELLRIDNIDLEEHHKTLKAVNPKLSKAEEYITSRGKGYVHIAGIGRMYDRILGKKIFDGQSKDYLEFEEKFNNRFKALGDNPLGIIQEELKQGFNSPNATSIYKCYETGLRIFKIDRKLHYEKNGFDLYDYLKKSNKVMKCLPTRDIKDFTMDKGLGVPEKLFGVLSDIDKQFVVKYINPDIMNIEDETLRNNEINKLVSIINILRENVNTLSKEDIEKISYGKIQEYTHNGMDCLILRAGNNAFQTFINNSGEPNYQFMPYCSFKNPQEYNSLFNIDTDKHIRQDLADIGQQLSDNYTMSMVMNVGGPFGNYGLVESNGKYFTTSGEIKEVKLDDIQNLTVQTKLEEKKIVQDKRRSNI